MDAPCYYVYRRDGIPAINAIQPWETNPPASLTFTDYVFVNRPDLRFQGRDHEAILSAAKFKLVQRFSGFEVWKSGYVSDWAGVSVDRVAATLRYRAAGN
jgi:hypothetical protein